jgi:hypothetical protein
MRFVILVLAMTGVGAAAGLSLQATYPQSTQMFAAVRALGGDRGQARVPDVNPVKAYEDVRRKITSPEPGAFPKLGSPPSISVAPMPLPKPVVIDQKQIDRAVAAGINARIQQDIRRSQDIMQYSRNPTGWRGAPPH